MNLSLPDMSVNWYPTAKEASIRFLLPNAVRGAFGLSSLFLSEMGGRMHGLARFDLRISHTEPYLL